MAEIILAAIYQKRARGNEVIIFQESADISMAHKVYVDVI